MLDHRMEDFVPVVGKLAEKYNAYEHTSMTYEKAEQLMGAVLYCVREAKQDGHNVVIPAESRSAQQMYEAGVLCVERKVKQTLALYNQILPEFEHYENRCLYDTFVGGIPEFFKWYDIRFEPQNTILTLDYPVLRDLSEYTGIDRINEFVKCIWQEQRFLSAFPKEYVIKVLCEYSRQYKEMVDNICEVVLEDVIKHILAKRPVSEPFSENDRLRIKRKFEEKGCTETDENIRAAVKAFVQSYYEDYTGLLEYFEHAVDGIIIRLKNGILQE